MDSKITIIAIDDEETMLRIVKRSLEPEGYFYSETGTMKPSFEWDEAKPPCRVLPCVSVHLGERHRKPSLLQKS